MEVAIIICTILICATIIWRERARARAQKERLGSLAPLMEAVLPMIEKALAAGEAKPAFTRRINPVDKYSFDDRYECWQQAHGALDAELVKVAESKEEAENWLYNRE